eukprot:3856084-Pyramimonas_sp.AAC.1
MEPLFEVYQELLAHGRLPDEFNHGIAVFLPKGDAPSDAVDAVFRPPEQTRPITLGNLDNKLISRAINKPVVRVLQECCIDFQRGFIPGR